MSEKCLIASGKQASQQTQTNAVGGGVYMNFLGHRVGNGTMMIPEKREDAILEYTKPMTKRGLRSFLGAVSFYRCYV